MPTMYRTAGPLIGYDVGCPACGRRDIWRHPDDATLAEGAPVEASVIVELATGPRSLPFWHAESLNADRGRPCLACGATVTLEGTAIRATAGVVG